MTHNYPIQDVPALLRDSVRRHGDILALRDDRSEPTVRLTYRELDTESDQFAHGLITLGVQHGDRIAMLADNRPRWIISDVGILKAGAINVPRGSDTAIPEIWYILNHSEAKVAIIQNVALLSAVLSATDTNAALDIFVMLDDSADQTEHRQGIQVINYSDVLQRGAERTASGDAELPQIVASDTATIVYTSGTTGIPKGAMLTHGNLSFEAQVIDLGANFQPGELLLTVLPTWHVYERMVEYYAIFKGATLVYSNKRYLREDLGTVRPHVLPCVPRMWESIYDAVQTKVRKAPKARQKIFKFFTTASLAFVHSRRIATGHTATVHPPSILSRALFGIAAALLYPIHALGDKLVYKAIREVTGGRLRAAVSGGGSLAPYLDDFFEAIGVLILNGYGLTETSPVLSIRRIDHNVRGTVGPPLKDTQIQIRDEHGKLVGPGVHGIIWASGAQVMAGYYKNLEATRQVLDENGWFNTGDIGWFTHSGNLVISGRAKDTIVLSTGENVEPEPIENVIRQSPLVQQVVVVGQDESTLGALVVPEFAAVAAKLGLSAETSESVIANDPKASKIVRDEILKLQKADGSFKAFEIVQKVGLITEAFSEANGLLTQTLKPKRNLILKQHRDDIEKLYRP